MENSSHNGPQQLKMNFEKVFSTPFFDIEAGSDPRIEGSEPYYRMTGSDSVICCVLTTKGEFVFVKQYRPNLNQVTLELPAGHLESGEKPAFAADREFLEETGMVCGLIYLGDFSLMMNRTTIKEHIFFGLGPTHVQGHILEEGTSVELIERKEVLNRAFSGEYRQLAGLGVIQLASGRLGLDVLSDPLADVVAKFYEEKQKNES